MSYFIDEDSTNLDELQERLEITDLIPSLRPLLDGLTEKMSALKKIGMKSIADLRSRMKSKKSLASLSDDSGINTDYLVLLRRAILGFFPKPQPLGAFNWLDMNILVKLNRVGVRDTRQLYEATSSDLDKLAGNAGLKKSDLSEFMALSDLSRIQWVSPVFARVLVAAGFTSAALVATADSEALYEAIIRANDKARFYKGRVGLRDIKRLITAAAFVPPWRYDQALERD